MSTDVMIIAPPQHSIARSVARPGAWRTNLGIVPVVVGAVAAAPKIAALLDKIKPIKKVFDAVKGTLSKLGIGGVDQERFLKRFHQADDIMDAAGYNGKHTEELYQKFKIGASQIENHKSSGNYYAEFQRLRGWIIARLNIYNPGLGDLYGQYFPDFPMADNGTSLGQMSGEPIQALEEFVKIAPGTFTSPDQVKQALEIAKSGTASQAPTSSTTTPGAPATTQPGTPQQATSSTPWLIGGGLLTAAITFLK